MLQRFSAIWVYHLDLSPTNRLLEISRKQDGEEEVGGEIMYIWYGLFYLSKCIRDSSSMFLTTDSNVPNDNLLKHRNTENVSWLSACSITKLTLCSWCCDDQCCCHSLRQLFSKKRCNFSIYSDSDLWSYHLNSKHWWCPPMLVRRVIISQSESYSAFPVYRPTNHCVIIPTIVEQVTIESVLSISLLPIGYQPP